MLYPKDVLELRKWIDLALWDLNNIYRSTPTLRELQFGSNKS